jgi:hypothetical protein
LRARQKAGWKWEMLRLGHTSPDKIKEERSFHARLLNRFRGEGKNSPYKLTGLGKEDEWALGVLRLIDSRGPANPSKFYSGEVRRRAMEAAEQRALEKWLKKSPEKRKAMEEWLKKHGKRK